MDIDIDTKPSFDPKDHFNITPASMVQDGLLIKHPCGCFFQTIPIDSITKLAAIPYKQAEEIGYTKIDFLHLSVLDYFSSKEEIKILLKKEPDWALLLNQTVVSKLFQLNKHVDLLQQVKPTSVIELSDTIALIRPGKRQFLNQYLQDKDKNRCLLYRQGTDDKSSFRRGHAISYSLTVVLQLHLIKAGIL